MVVIQGQRGDLKNMLADLKLGGTVSIVYTTNTQTGFVQRVHVVGTQWVLDLSNDVNEAVFLSDVPRAIRVRTITIT